MSSVVHTALNSTHVYETIPADPVPLTSRDIMTTNGIAPSDGDNNVNIILSVPDFRIQIDNMSANLTESVWNIKLQVISHVTTAIKSEMKDSLNYGLYIPPVNGRAGKFLDEERFLKDYSLSSGSSLELKYKRREYKQGLFKQRKLIEFNTKTYRKKFLHYVRLGNVTKLSKLLQKGLDPNFQEEESGETPLTLSVVLISQPRAAIMTLVEGGAFLDYRNFTSLTAMHRAAQTGKKDAIRALLDLGASPNSKDDHGLTPLYHCISSSVERDAECVEMLLRDYAQHGIADSAGSTELHHACRYGRTKQVEQLLYFGVFINSMNKAGNTALHVCALTNQDACARMLLFRGADKSIRNYANQTAVQLAQLCGNSAVAEIIEQFSESDAVPHKEKPTYNVMRKSVKTRTEENSAAVDRPPSNLMRLKSLSHSTPQLLDDVSDSVERPKQKRNRKPHIGSPVPRDAALLHSVGIPTVAEDGQVVLKFVKSPRIQYDSDSPCFDDNSSGSSFHSDDLESPSVVSTPRTYDNLPTRGKATSGRISGYWTVSNASSAQLAPLRNRDTMHVQGQSPERDGNIASIRNSHKRMTASIILTDAFIDLSAGAVTSTDVYQNTPGSSLLLASFATTDNKPIHDSRAAPPVDKTSTSVTTGSVAASREKFGGSMNCLLDFIPAREKREPPPPPNRKSSKFPPSVNITPGGGPKFVQPDAVSDKAVFKRFGSVDNLLDIDRQKVSDLDGDGGRWNRAHEDATSSGKDIDWTHLASSKIKQFQQSRVNKPSSPQVSGWKQPLVSGNEHQVGFDDDEDLPPPPTPSLFNFTDAKQSELIVYAPLPMPQQSRRGVALSVATRPDDDESTIGYDSAANMRAAAEVLLKNLKSESRGKSAADDAASCEGTFDGNRFPKPPSFKPPPPTPASAHGRVTEVAMANAGGKKKSPPSVPSARPQEVPQGGEVQDIKTWKHMDLAAIIADRARRQQDS